MRYRKRCATCCGHIRRRDSVGFPHYGTRDSVAFSPMRWAWANPCNCLPLSRHVRGMARRSSSARHRSSTTGPRNARNSLPILPWRSWLAPRRNAATCCGGYGQWRNRSPRHPPFPRHPPKARTVRTYSLHPTICCVAISTNTPAAGSHAWCSTRRNTSRTTPPR